jgi:hypothetical protein
VPCAPLRPRSRSDFGSPLWIPPWPTCEPSHVNLADPNIFGEGLEGRHLLPHIAGHNLCLDVFGNHSEAEIQAATPGSVAGPTVAIHPGMHGEAGMCTWHVVASEQTAAWASVTLRAHLRRTALEVQRTFSVTVDSSAIKVNEQIRNLVGFERALGCGAIPASQTLHRPPPAVRQRLPRAPPPTTNTVRLMTLARRLSTDCGTPDTRNGRQRTTSP